MSKAVLITGGNLGSVAENLEAAREAISREVGVVERCSSVLESEAWGFEAEERFLNQVLVVATALPPEQLLERCLQIERQLGRVRRPGPRPAVLRRSGRRQRPADDSPPADRRKGFRAGAARGGTSRLRAPGAEENDPATAPRTAAGRKSAGRGQHEKLTKNHYLCFLFSD